MHSSFPAAGDCCVIHISPAYLGRKTVDAFFGFQIFPLYRHNYSAYGSIIFGYFHDDEKKHTGMLQPLQYTKLAEQKYTLNFTLNNMPTDCLDFDFNFTLFQNCGSSYLILVWLFSSPFSSIKVYNQLKFF